MAWDKSFSGKQKPYLEPLKNLINWPKQVGFLDIKQYLKGNLANKIPAVALWLGTTVGAAQGRSLHIYDAIFYSTQIKSSRNIETN